ncbi:MAG: amidohydrolase [Rhodospirillaceae bacterium]|jgi:predicted amidohydrolase YtcJ|nr:amidohydrolase [Rhodospirillaceae bacterium]MBT5194836.1 amidohydrolase [Rhodospirillaceae bacterium]MBT6428180.1 amidohydrolase [Rhodospirillaceae bacterium]MBT7760940.1 amidohydrolase [Rhodospirillaceae bacterium]
MSEIVIYAARKIITMNNYQAEASHVAVRDGRILGVGALDDLTGWGDHSLDDRFADKVLTPGFVEGHCHLMEGSIWRYHYVGFHSRTGPDGALHEGLNSIDAVADKLARIEAEMTDPDAPLVAWGFDPIYFEGRRMDLGDMDRISTNRHVVVLHSNLHLLNASRTVLEAANITAETNIEGIAKDAQGNPTGELQEMAAKFMALDTIGLDYFTETAEKLSLDNFGRIATQTGVTTATDLFNAAPEAAVANLAAWTKEEDFRFRIAPAFGGATMPGAQGVERVHELMKLNNDNLRFGIVKLVTDGSIQGMTGRMKWPGYYNGEPNGVWNTGPDELEGLVQAYHDGGLQVYIHVNADEASEVALNAIENVLTRSPRRDHRHTLQHCQMADESQYRRMAALGVGVNLFSNHIYYWGDEHRAKTMGPDRAKRANATATAQRLGVPFAIHSDAPVTPLGPLFTAWCAVNRLTASGYLLGPNERISVGEALRAITLGAAHAMKMDHEVGSIEVGKRADFAVLEEDPTAVAPVDLRDVPVWGTVMGGRVFQAGDGN